MAFTAAHPQHPEVTVVSNVADDEMKKMVPKDVFKDGRRHYYHIDSQFKPAPSGATILQMKLLPESGDGDTLFVDMYAAYETLDDAMKEKLAGLRAGQAVDKHVRKDFVPDEYQKKILVAIQTGNVSSLWNLFRLYWYYRQ